MVGPPWLADEMLGRLARYLRLLGQDTAYVRGWADSRIAEEVEREDRALLTRDRELASRVPSSVLLRSVEIGGQIVEVHRAFPTGAWAPAFTRCTLCNGPLRPVAASERSSLPPVAAPADLDLYRCGSCGHVYWEGTHTQRVREQVAAWLGGEAV